MCHAKQTVGSTSLSPHRGSLERGSLVGTLHYGGGDVEKLACPVSVSGQSQDPHLWSLDLALLLCCLVLLTSIWIT